MSAKTLKHVVGGSAGLPPGRVWLVSAPYEWEESGGETRPAVLLYCPAARPATWEPVPWLRATPVPPHSGMGSCAGVETGGAVAAAVTRDGVG